MKRVTKHIYQYDWVNTLLYIAYCVLRNYWLRKYKSDSILWPIIGSSLCVWLYLHMAWAADNGRDCKQVKDDVNRVKNAIIRYGVQTNIDTRPTTYLYIGLLFQIRWCSALYCASILTVNSILHFVYYLNSQHENDLHDNTKFMKSEPFQRLAHWWAIRNTVSTYLTISSINRISNIQWKSVNQMPSTLSVTNWVDFRQIDAHSMRIRCKFNAKCACPKCHAIIK